MREHDLQTESVARVDARISARRLEHTNRPAPRSALDAKLSAQYVLARVLADREVTLAHFEDASYRDATKRATTWHSDETHKQTISRLAMLHGLEVPREGGGTLFADMRAAFNALPSSECNRLRQMTGLHKFTAGPADAARMRRS